MTFDHVCTQSLYFLDPDGNRLGFYSQIMAAPDAKQYLHDARVQEDVLRPLDLEAATA